MAPSPDALRVNRTLSIPLHELEWRFTPSGGPGGQHANRASTRAEVVFDVVNSRSLGPRQRRRLLEKLGPEVRAAADDQRSQTRNRELALERLQSKLVEGLRVERQRVATKPSRAADRRRMEQKRRRSQVKNLRKRPPVDDA